MKSLIACLICVISVFSANFLFASDKDLQRITNHLNEYALRSERGLETHPEELTFLLNQLHAWYAHESRNSAISSEAERQFLRLDARIRNFLKPIENPSAPNPISKPTIPNVPGNDNCQSAYTVDNGTYYGHTSLATADGWATCNNSTSPDVWFLYTPQQNNTVVFTTAGSDYQTVISIHNPNTNGCPGDPTDQIACSGDGYPAPKIVLPVDAGSSYLIRISGKGSDSTGNYVLTIQPAGFISGKVVDAATEAPIPNSDILFYRQNGGQVGSTITNANGDYVSPELPSGTYFVRTADNKDFVDELYDNIPCNHGNCNPYSGTPIVVDSSTVPGINFALNRTGSISGQVTAATNSIPLYGVSLNAYDSNGQQQGYTSTDSDGNFMLTGLDQGTYFLRTNIFSDDYIDELYDDISCPGFCDPTTGTPISVTYGNNTPAINFALDLGGRITGAIKDSIDLSPLYSGYIRVYDSSGNFVDVTSPEFQTGVYVSSGLPSGNYFVQTGSTDDHIEELYDNFPCNENQCDTLNGTPVPVVVNTVTEDINFLLDRSGSISGKLTDESDSPVTSSYVSAYDSNGFFVSYDYTDENGEYVIGDLVTGDYFIVTSSQYLDEAYDDHPCDPFCDLSTADPIPVVVSNETTGIDFVLGDGGSISGTIIDALTLAPVQNIYVYVYNSSGNFVGNTTTDSSGQYTVSGLVTGNYFVQTQAFGGYLNELYDDIPCVFGCNILSGTPVPVSPGSPTTGIDFELMPVGKITGTIKNAATDQPIPGIYVQIYDSNGNFVNSGFSDSSGTYYVNIFVADNYYVAAIPNNTYLTELYNNVHCIPYSCDFSLGTQVPADVGIVTAGIDFDLDIGGSISGSITDELNGSPINSAFIYIYDVNGNSVGSASVNEDGTFVSDSTLMAGDYFVRVEAYSGYASELYDNHPCDPSCNVTDGDPVTVTEGNTTANINFALNRPTVSIDDVSISEGNSGAQEMTFTVTLSSPSQDFVKVWFEDDDGTAYGNLDFQPVFGFVNINPGNISATISVPIFGDTELEPDETFTMRLTQASNVTIVDGEGTGTIINDDAGCPVITIDPPTLPDGAVGVFYIVTLSASGGTPPYNFYLTSGTLPLGMTLNGNLINGTPEVVDTYTFQLAVSDAQGCTSIYDYTITVTGSCQLMGDDFQDGIVDPSLWTIVKPSFVEEGGEFIGTPLNRKAQAVATGFAGCGANCTMETTMELNQSDSKLSALGWYQDKANNIEIIMKQDKSQWIIKQRANGKVVAKAKGSGAISHFTPYIVRISFDGQQFMLHVTDNVNTLDLIMEKAPGTNPFGTFGYLARGTTGRFTSICVN